MKAKDRKRYIAAREKMLAVTANLREYAESLPPPDEDGNIPAAISVMFVEDLVLLLDCMAATSQLADRHGK